MYLSTAFLRLIPCFELLHFLSCIRPDDLAKKLLHALIVRICKEMFRRSFLDDRAVRHKHNSVRNLTSLTDVPFAVTEAELLAELGWNIRDNEWDVSEGLFSESVMRRLIAKYESGEWVSFYNDFVFMTTDTSKTARQIINTYELRPEIEEDFRQMKDFWKLEDFKSTKYNYITYHIIMTLIGYLYFQIYKNLDEGKRYSGKSLPVVVKNYKETRPKSVIIYVGQYFGIFPFLELLQIYAECTLEVRRLLDPILAKV